MNGLYQISNFGNVKSLKLGKEKILSKRFDKVGYSKVILYKDNEYKSILVHRLVAEAFIANPDNLSFVNHKDENKSNNNVDNLEWCDARYNKTYSNGRKVVQYTLDGELIKVWNSIAEIERNGYTRSHLCYCLKGMKKQYKGYIWKYLM